MILVSSCLLGIKAKYDGGVNTCELLMRYCRLGKYVPICPEQLGGLATPRLPVELQGGGGEEVLAGKAIAVNCEGEDVTEKFVEGARQVLSVGKMFTVTAAVLKERSPSCGAHQIYDGSFRHITTMGQGITAALLRQSDIPVYSQTELTPELLERLLKK